MEKLLGCFNFQRSRTRAPEEKIVVEVGFQRITASISRRKREEFYLETNTSYKYPLSSPPPQHTIKTQHFLSFWYHRIPNSPKSPNNKMLLYVSLLLQSLILDPFLIPNGPDDFGMRYMAGEEVEVEREIVATIIAGNSTSLPPNSGEPIMIHGNNISVGYHDERGSNYRVWEWHGHIMTYDELNGVSLNYIQGYYHESIPERHGCRRSMTWAGQ
ncbi:hypothetical protein AAC387_Pa04g1590 [Persea americana]